MLPVDIVLGPDWWHAHAGICFDRDFFFHPARRVQDERKMERILYERWGRWGLGEDRERDIPLVGATHLAAGFMLSEMLGCNVEYRQDAPPQVLPGGLDDLKIDEEAAFACDAMRRFERMTEALKSRFGRLAGDVNWGGALNIGMDLRGQDLLMDLLDQPLRAREFLRAIARVLERFAAGVERQTGSSSISVNRNVRHLPRPVFLHSECSHTMISVECYEQALLPIDIAWSRAHRPFGIHYCGADPHRFAASFARIPHLDFLDVGWGGDVAALRRALPDTFLNIRLSPVEIVSQSPEAIRSTIRQKVAQSADPYRTGICCINMDRRVGDQQVAAILESVAELRSELCGQPRPLG